VGLRQRGSSACARAQAERCRHTRCCTAACCRCLPAVAAAVIPVAAPLRVVPVDLPLPLPLPLPLSLPLLLPLPRAVTIGAPSLGEPCPVFLGPPSSVCAFRVLQFDKSLASIGEPRPPAVLSPAEQQEREVFLSFITGLLQVCVSVRVFGCAPLTHCATHRGPPGCRVCPFVSLPQPVCWCAV
jgi:hypothetical protein